MVVVGVVVVVTVVTVQVVGMVMVGWVETKPRRVVVVHLVGCLVRKAGYQSL